MHVSDGSKVQVQTRCFLWERVAPFSMDLFYMHKEMLYNKITERQTPPKPNLTSLTVKLHN